MNTPRTIEAMLTEADRFSIRVNRAIECRGICRLTDSDIQQMLNLCQARSIQLFLSIGSRATYDTGAFAYSKNGARMGYRIRGKGGIQRALEEVYRAVSLGVTGILVYDEGLLSLLNRLRDEGTLPKQLKFKASVHMGCANPYSAELLERIGADSINLVPDLPIQDLSEVRRRIRIPIDLFTDTAGEAGGLLRTAEAGDFVRATAPTFLKCGPISQTKQNHLPSEDEIHERIRQTRCVVETLQRAFPEAEQLDTRKTTGSDRPFPVTSATELRPETPI